MSNQTKVGIVIITCLVILGAIVTWKSSVILKFTGYEMIGSFSDVEGLTTGSEVRYRGFTIGKVMRIDPTPVDIKIYCVIDKSRNFPSDSFLRIAFDGLVGLKYLEIRPGLSSDLYKPGSMLYGQKTSGIVDFVDIGTQNLVETKKILMAIANIVERPDIQKAFVNAVLNVEKATVEINRLTEQLQIATASVNGIIADKNFQEDVKGTIASTHTTLASANQFFEGFADLRVKPSADVLFGTKSNQVKGNLDISQNEFATWKMSMGEGPTNNLALLDLQISSIVAKNLGLRIGMINTHLGGGVDYYANKDLTLSGDIYNINNPRPNLPMMRLTSDYKLSDFANLLLQADDFLNSATANYSIGVRVKGK